MDKCKNHALVGAARGDNEDLTDDLMLLPLIERRGQDAGSIGVGYVLTLASKKTLSR